MDQVRIVTDEDGTAEATVAEVVMDEAVASAKTEEAETLVVEEAAAVEAEAEEAVAEVAAAGAEGAEPVVEEVATEVVTDDIVAGVADAEAEEAVAEVAAAEAEEAEPLVEETATEVVTDDTVAAAADAEAEETEDSLDESAAGEEEPEGTVEEEVASEAVLVVGSTEQELSASSEMGELPVEDWDYQRPKRGQVRSGIILAIHEQEIIVDVGVKRDGLVPYADMQRMGPEALEQLSVGDEVPVYILRPEDQDGNLLVSLYMARQTQAWTRAEELAKSGKVWEEAVVGFNKGGVVVPVDEIRGFVPASQLPGFPAGLSQEDRLEKLSTFVGETLRVKVIEINRRKRRLILSARSAHRQWRKQQRQKLLEELREGEVRTGTVSSLANFGAFIDLGGADGLVHLSELSWQRVRHPKEVLKVGEKVEVYILRLDRERNRIGLSLKRLQPEPWALVEDKYELGQLIEGVVTNVVDFGAFAEIEEGVEGLIHTSELTDAKISHPRDVVKKGDLLLLRIIRIDARRKRLGLSLKRVLESEWAEWAAQVALAEAQKEEPVTLEETTAEPAPVEEVEAPAPPAVEAEPVEVETEAEPSAAGEVAPEEEPATLEEAAAEPAPVEEVEAPAPSAGEEAEPVEVETEAEPPVADQVAPAEEVPEESAPEEGALLEEPSADEVSEATSVPEALAQVSEEATKEDEVLVEEEPEEQAVVEDSGSEADVSGLTTEDAVESGTGEEPVVEEAVIEASLADSAEPTDVDA